MKQLIFAIIIALIAVIFALQNAEPVTVNFFFWEMTEVSMVLILLGTFVMGILVGLMFLATGIFKRNSTISSQKKRILELEKEISKKMMNN